MCIHTDSIFRIVTLRADRARRFIADPDPWSILALIGTASYHQVPVLRDALYRHVAFQTFIGVTFTVWHVESSQRITPHLIVGR